MMKGKTFEKIEGIKKVRRCVVCGKKIIVKNLNQIKCENCGYKATYKLS